MIALTNGNYVVVSPFWDGNRGAVTWAVGTQATAAIVAASNSLVGSTVGDEVGNFLGGPGFVLALANGNYVVDSPLWSVPDGPTQVGAVTWGSGTEGVVGAISSANSLIGSSASDRVGGSADDEQLGLGIVGLANGAYIVLSPDWELGTVPDVGAVTYAQSDGSTVGLVGPANSLVGSFANDEVGDGGVIVQSDGGVLIYSPQAATGSGTFGALTAFAAGSGATADGKHVVTATNSILGFETTQPMVNIELPLPQVVAESNPASFVVATQTGTRLSLTVAFTDANELTFDRGQGTDITVTPDFIANTLAAGTNVTLQASNDLTVDSPLLVTPTGAHGGNLTLQAGRSILIDADIMTAGGALTLLANDTADDGVVNGERDPGAASITVASGVTVDTGGGSLTLDLLDGAGNTNEEASGITLTGASLQGGSVMITAGDVSSAETFPRLTFIVSSTEPSPGLILGDVTSNGDLDIASAGSLELSGAVRTSAVGDIEITNGSALVLDPTGSLFADGAITQDGVGNVFLDGGSITTDPSTIRFSSDVIISDNTTLDAGTSDIEFDSTLSILGSTAIMKAAHVLLGPDTFLDNGTLATAGNVLVSGTLEGIGTITGPVSVATGGTVSPGLSAGSQGVVQERLLEQQGPSDGGGLQRIPPPGDIGLQNPNGPGLNQPPSGSGPGGFTFPMPLNPVIGQLTLGDGITFAPGSQLDVALALSGGARRGRRSDRRGGYDPVEWCRLARHRFGLCTDRLRAIYDRSRHQCLGVQYLCPGWPGREQRQQCCLSDPVQPVAHEWSCSGLCPPGSRTGAAHSKE